VIVRLAGQVGLAYAFVEREVALSRRYWAWELMWIVYGIATSLSVALIGRAAPTISGQTMDDATLSRFALYLLVGSVAWRYLGIVFENITEVIAWERWEGTIEYTFMAPVHRVTHLAGMCVSSVLRATLFSVVIVLVVMLFLPVDLSRTNGASVLVLLAVGSVAFGGLSFAAAVFPMLWTEKGLQMAYIVQAVVLLVSGVYYPVDVLPGWMQALAVVSPATYVIHGLRAAVVDGAAVATLWPDIWPALAIGAVSLPLGLRGFLLAERYAKRTGRLKRSG
jgi:ABC-2 type transport system permease protein